eukprot:TRINITY_DN4924_c0_g6_i1.p1 TRINITY_DN4924_c0_g6~~TRINITY_DN4924_c0_g6_i1.p1  ORF type:complete len:208 (+),score=58.12 TRINITY_DN4924_c0_g6_i1:95-718(+)
MNYCEAYGQPMHPVMWPGAMPQMVPQYPVPPPQMQAFTGGLDDGYMLWMSAVNGGNEVVEEKEPEITFGIIDEAGKKKKKKKNKKNKKRKARGRQPQEQDEDAAPATRSVSCPLTFFQGAELKRRSSSVPPVFSSSEEHVPEEAETPVVVSVPVKIPAPLPEDDAFDALAARKPQPSLNEPTASGSLRMGGNQLHPMRHILSSCFEK